MEIFAGVAIALYVGHHVGDYWVQTDDQSKAKGTEHGESACLFHVLSYVITQAVCVAAVVLVTGTHIGILPALGGLAVSGVTHYLADRREYGLMFKLARIIPGKARFLTLGVPRDAEVCIRSNGANLPRGPVPLDNPSLGTGAWALDQSWHIFWGVFVAGLIMSL